jgi:chromatin remodeling complex protein RSC6
MSTVEQNGKSNQVGAVDDEDEYISDQFGSLLNTLGQFKIQITAMANQMKSLEKNVKKEIKQNKKEIVKKQNKGNRKPSGFAAASPISKDLCNFMGKDEGTSIARTEVTKFICSYIKQHSLTDSENNKVIKPDKKLQSLLGADPDAVITYFNIQRFMNKHFVKKDNIIEKSA